MKRIGISLGETYGIGPEIVTSCLNKLSHLECIVYGNKELLKGLKGQTNISIKDPGLALPQSIDDTTLRAQHVLQTLDMATQDALDGTIDALVTAPIDKQVVASVLPGFSGHTEYLKEKSKSTQSLMLMNFTDGNMLLLSHHIPLREVAKAMHSQHIVESIELANTSLQAHFSLEKIRFGLCGLNPHAGELQGHFEEKEAFIPAIRALQASGIDIQGPFAADSMIPMNRSLKRFDVMVSPYHDQALVAAKYLGLDQVSNITLGLPFLRLSPGHGVAYDIAGKGIASDKSLLRAIDIALKGKL